MLTDLVKAIEQYRCAHCGDRPLGIAVTKQERRGLWAEAFAFAFPPSADDQIEKMTVDGVPLKITNAGGFRLID